MVIDYHPENIAGYADALAAAIKDNVPEAEARQRLRDDNNFCERYNFRGSAYVSKSSSISSPYPLPFHTLTPTAQKTPANPSP